MNIKKISPLFTICAISLLLSACHNHTIPSVELPVVPTSTSHVLPAGTVDSSVISRVGVTRLATPTTATYTEPTRYTPVSNNSQLMNAFNGLGFETRKTNRGVIVYLPRTVHFGNNLSAITPAMQVKLSQFVNETNKSYLAGRNIIVSGHTDSLGSSQSNLQLSSRRASSVQRKLLQLGTQSGRVTSQGFGETAPRYLDPSHQHLNRRVEFLILN